MITDFGWLPNKVRILLLRKWRIDIPGQLTLSKLNFLGSFFGNNQLEWMCQLVLFCAPLIKGFSIIINNF